MTGETSTSCRPCNRPPLSPGARSCRIAVIHGLLPAVGAVVWISTAVPDSPRSHDPYDRLDVCFEPNLPLGIVHVPACRNTSTPTHPQSWPRVIHHTAVDRRRPDHQLCVAFRRVYTLGLFRTSNFRSSLIFARVTGMSIHRRKLGLATVR